MNSAFGSLHPLNSFLYYMGIVLFSMLLFHPLFLVTGLLGIVCVLLVHGQGMRLVKLLPFYILFGGIIAILNPLFSHRGQHILFYFMDQPITGEAILYGVMTMLSILSIVLTFLSFQQIITPDKFMFLFSRVAPKTSLLALMSLRFVPLFLRRLSQISLIQRTRGINIREGRLAKRVKDGLTLLRVLLVWSLEEALQTADSMKARGYGTAKRSSYTVFRMDRRDRTMVVYLSVVMLLCIAGWTQGYGELAIYPHLEQAVFTWQEALMYGCYCAFLLTPVYMEGKEFFAWKLFK